MGIRGTASCDKLEPCLPRSLHIQHWAIQPFPWWFSFWTSFGCGEILAAIPFATYESFICWSLFFGGSGVFVGRLDIATRRRNTITIERVLFWLVRRPIGLLRLFVLQLEWVVVRRKVDFVDVVLSLLEHLHLVERLWNPCMSQFWFLKLYLV